MMSSRLSSTIARRRTSSSSSSLRSWRPTSRRKLRNRPSSSTFSNSRTRSRATLKSQICSLIPLIPVLRASRGTIATAATRTTASIPTPTKKLCLINLSQSTIKTLKIPRMSLCRWLKKMKNLPVWRIWSRPLKGLEMGIRSSGPSKFIPSWDTCWQYTSDLWRRRKSPSSGQVQYSVIKGIAAKER